MLDTKSVTELVEQQITIAVENQVSQILSDVQWMDEIEAKIIRHIQDRITARFTNLGSMPDLIDTVESSVSRLIEQGHIPGIDQYVDSTKVATAVDNAVQIMVQESIDSLVLDTEWLQKIERMVGQAMTTRVTERISGIDINSVIVNEIDSALERWRDMLMQNFRTKGLFDRADELQLTVGNEGVEIKNALSTLLLDVKKDADVTGTMTVQNLVVKGSVNTDNKSWDELASFVATKAYSQLVDNWQTDLVGQVLELAQTKGIDFKNVNINGFPLVDGSMLNPTITESNIQQIGVLKELKVAGPAAINDTVTIKGRRLGVNTTDPEMALSVWDEEVSLLSGKFSQNTAYIGTGRKQSLAIGINRTPAITIDENGLTTIKQLRLDRFQIGHATAVPGHSGTRGDFIFNSDPKPNQPFAWVCLGGFRWQALKSA